MNDLMENNKAFCGSGNHLAFGLFTTTRLFAEWTYLLINECKPRQDINEWLLEDIETCLEQVAQLRILKVREHFMWVNVMVQ